MTIDDLINHTPGGQTSVVVVLAGALVSIVLLIARRAAASVARIEASVQRLGSRIGALETDLSSETTRRRQLEQCLREHGIRPPYWPDDPVELYLAGHLDDYQPPAAPETNWIPTQDFSRHRLERST